MIDWNKIKIESIEAMYEISVNGANTTSIILKGEGNKDLSKITFENWKSICMFYLENYKLACKNLEELPDNNLIEQAKIFINHKY